MHKAEQVCCRLWRRGSCSETPERRMEVSVLRSGVRVRLGELLVAEG